jgi:predicted DNA-binding WGR domain protein
MQHFEFSDDKSHKFWEVEQEGCEVHVCFGKIGTAGQRQTKSHPDAATAAAAVARLIKEKTSKGYTLTASTPATPAARAVPASASASAPASAPACAATPVIASPLSAPSRVFAPGTPPWLAGPCIIEPHAKLAGLALPSRRSPGPPPRSDADACWIMFTDLARQHIAADFQSGQTAYLAGIVEAQARLADNTRDGARLSDAVLLAVDTAASYYTTSADGSPFLDYLVATKGLLYACDIFCLMQAKVAFEVSRHKAVCDLKFGARTEQPLAVMSRYQYCHAELALRAHLAHADETLWTQCADLIEAAIARVPLRRKPLLCVLLPERPQLSNELALRHGSQIIPDAFSWLRLSVDAADAEAELRKATVTDAYDHHGFFNCPQAMASMLAERGADAVPLLAVGAIVEEAALALGSIGTPAAINTLARGRKYSKDCMLRFVEAMRRWPLAAIAALSEKIASDTDARATLPGILASHARANSDALEAIKPWLTPAAALVLDEVNAKLAVTYELADHADLPLVLASPPWKGKSRKAAAAIKLDPLPLAPMERWEEGQREALLDPSPGYRQRLDALAADPQEHARWLGMRDGPWVDKAAAAIRAHDLGALTEAVQSFARTGSYFQPSGAAIARLPSSMAASFFNTHAAMSIYHADYALAYLGLAALPGLKNIIEGRTVTELHFALPFAAVELAPAMARAYARLKKVRGTAREWLLAFPEHAACGLIAAALGKAGEARDCASAALRLLAGAGNEAMLFDVAARYGQPQVGAALRAMLDEDPLDLHPARVGPLPPFWDPVSWTRPLLASNGKALPEHVLDLVGEMMRFPATNGHYAGLAQLRQACTSESLAAFGWDAMMAWIDAGAPSKESWVLSALGQLGNDATAHKLAPLLRAWPSEGQSARAIAGLDVLAQIGSDTAVMLLHAIGQKAKSRPLQDAARLKIEQVAEARELTAEELADRITPDCGLDDQGTLMLDFGPRSFRVGFDEALKPYVRDQDGVRLPDLPKPRQSDNEELAAAAQDQFKRLKKDVRAIASQQVQRLETAMCVQRRWSPGVFRIFLAGHPLVRSLVQRLVWGAYRAGILLACFRVSQEGEWTSADDGAFTLPEGDDIRIGIPHALEIPAAQAAAFGQLFADYELLQPFIQIGRATHALSADDATSTNLTRWAATSFRTKNVLGLASRGWRRGTPQSHGLIWHFTKELGNGHLLELTLEPGIYAGDPETYPEQNVTHIRTGKVNGGGDIGTALPLSSLHPVAASELLRDIDKLRT